MLNIENLIKLGLSKNRARVYYYFTKNPKSTFSEVSKNLELKSSTTDKILSSLKELGLIDKIKAGTKTYYILQEPENLDIVIKEEKELFEEKKEILFNIEKQLQTTYESNIEGAPKVSFFNGIEGLKEHWSRLISKKISLIKQVVNYDLTLFPQERRGVAKRKKLLGNLKRDIICTTIKKPTPLDEGEVYAPYEKYSGINAEIDIYEDSVLFISGKIKKIGLLIEDKNIAKTMHVLHEMAKKGITKNTR